MKNQIKKLELDRSLEIEMLEKQLADWKKFNSQLQTTCQQKDLEIEQIQLGMSNERRSVKSQIAILDELKDMNLFQLILWKLKQ